MGLIRNITGSLSLPARRPNLRGVTVIVTRPEGSAEATIDFFEALGAKVYWAPATVMASRVECYLEQLQEGLDDVYQNAGWLIIPSPMAVRFFQAAVEQLKRPDSETTTIRVATVGKKSAQLLHREGWVSVFTPPEPSAASLAKKLPVKPRTPVLLLGSERGRSELRMGLKARGVRLHTVNLYTPENNIGGLQVLVGALMNNPEAILIVTSPSGVDSVWATLAGAAMSPAKMHWVAIGATTRDDLLKRGALADRVVTADRPDDLGLARAVASAVGLVTSAKESA